MLLAELVEVGATEAVVSALEMHAHEATAAECCCGALANLAVFSDRSQHTAFFAIAPRLCDLILVPHAGNLQVVKPAARLARNMAVDERLRDVFFQAEGVPALIEVMRRHARAGAATAAVLADCRMVLSCAQEYLVGAVGSVGGGGTKRQA